MSLDLLPDSPRPAPDPAPAVPAPALPGVTETPAGRSADPADRLAFADIDRTVGAAFAAIYGPGAERAQQQVETAVTREGAAAYDRLARTPEAFGPVADPALARPLADGLRVRDSLPGYAARTEPAGASPAEASPAGASPAGASPAGASPAGATPAVTLEAPHWHVADYAELARHRVPEAALAIMRRTLPEYPVSPTNAKLGIQPSQMPAQFVVQRLEDSRGGPEVNMDYYSVRVEKSVIARMGYDSPQEYLNHIRTNLNSYVAGRPFTAYGAGAAERWSSGEPLGTVMDINLVRGVERAAVVTSYVDSNRWVFSTLALPGDIAIGSHPVSGHREFGVSDNGDGTVTFYTKGVDRISGYLDRAADDAGRRLGRGDMVFDGGDAVWRSFQQGIYRDVSRVPGANPSLTRIQEPVVHRDDSGNRPSFESVRRTLMGR